jgi:hypothetical protein
MRVRGRVAEWPWGLTIRHFINILFCLRQHSKTRRLSGGEASATLSSPLGRHNSRAFNDFDPGVVKDAAAAEIREAIRGQRVRGGPPDA